MSLCVLAKNDQLSQRWVGVLPGERKRERESVSKSGVWTARRLVTLNNGQWRWPTPVPFSSHYRCRVMPIRSAIFLFVRVWYHCNQRVLRNRLEKIIMWTEQVKETYKTVNEHDVTKGSCYNVADALGSLTRSQQQIFSEKIRLKDWPENRVIRMYRSGFEIPPRRDGASEKKLLYISQLLLLYFR